MFLPPLPPRLSHFQMLSQPVLVTVLFPFRPQHGQKGLLTDQSEHPRGHHHRLHSGLSLVSPLLWRELIRPL